jgi:hypothetical protein
MPVTFVHCPACDYARAVFAYEEASRWYFFCPRCQHAWDTPSMPGPTATSYSRRRGEYVYDIEVFETAAPATAGPFYARVVNMVRREAGHDVSVNAELQDAYGATPDEAVSRIEAAVEKWVKDQTQPE